MLHFSDGTDAWNVTACQSDCTTGVMPISNCMAGAPVILSTPHFWYGHESLTEAIDGIHPIKDLHETIINVDPLTGVVLDGHKRIQVNVGLDQIPELSVLSNVSKMVFPVVWFDEYATLSEELQAEYVKTVTKPLNIVNGVTIGLGIVLGALLVVAGGILCHFYV